MAQMRTLENVLEARINLLNSEKNLELKEDCAICRKLDCDILFALLFICIIICFLALILFFWLKGLLSYEEISRTETLECDHIFDSSKPEGEFQLPMLPPPATISEQISRPEGPKNLQCIYTFVAPPKQRVKLNFDQFVLAGSAGNCEMEYIDIYSELEKPDDDLLSASFGGRYCGSVSPYVRISLNRVIVLVFHSRIASNQRNNLKFRGHYAFISDAPYQVGEKLSSGECDFMIDSKLKKRGSILSPTYPGTYPKNFRCTYLLNGKTGQRIRLLFRDFDIYFGGEHCPYDSLTVYDGPNNKYPIIRKICGLQQHLVIYSFGPNIFIEFNTTSPAKADPRGFSLSYEFSNRYVDVLKLMDNQLGITHLRGSECDLLVRSNRETIHYIHSPQYPLMYPANTTCTFIIDGLQGEQNLEEVILTFEKFAVLTEIISSNNSVRSKHSSADYDDEPCPTSYVGIALAPESIKTVLSRGEESNYDTTLCERLQNGSRALGPYISNGPRMVLVFSSNEKVSSNGDGQEPLGFKAKIQFKTDFGIPGEPIGDSNQCMFKFTKPHGWFNSPRYPANYPLDTNCTYIIKAKPDEQIQVYFEQFALYFDENSIETSCADYLEISDVFEKDGKETLQLQARYCANTFPGPTVTAFRSHELRVFFFSDHQGTGNGFKAIYQIRKAFTEEIPTKPVARQCGQRITRTDDLTSGWLVSPGYPIKYNKDLICYWEITVRSDHQILLNLVKMEIEGSMTAESVNCQNAVIRVDAERVVRAGHAVREICGTDETSIQPIISKSNTVRIRFFTSPDKVNGLKGFNFTWTEVKKIKDENECSHPSVYLCTYTKLCIDARLKCNGDENCGLHDDSDEAYCNKLENAADIRTVFFAAIFSGCIFLLIVGFFGYILKKKFDKRRDKRRRRRSKFGMKYQRKSFRNPKPISKTDPYLLPAPAASRLTHYNVTTDIIGSTMEQRNEQQSAPNGEMNKINPSLRHSLKPNDCHLFYG